MIPSGESGVTRDISLPLGYTKPDQLKSRELHLNSLYTHSHFILCSIFNFSTINFSLSMLFTSLERSWKFWIGDLRELPQSLPYVGTSDVPGSSQGWLVGFVFILSTSDSDCAAKKPFV